MYDCEVGKFIQVDPLSFSTPSWTPYRYAYSNPVFYYDPSGKNEDTYYIDKDGQLLHHSKDELPDAVIIVKDDKVDQFNYVVNSLEMKGIQHGDGANQYLRDNYTAQKFDLPSIENFYEQNKNDVHLINGEVPERGGFINEHGSYLYDNNGVISPGSENFTSKETDYVEYGNPDPKSTGRLFGKIHTHPNAGEPSNGGIWELTPSGTDRLNAPSKGSGFNIVVDKYNIHIYNQLNHVEIPRKK